MSFNFGSTFGTPTTATTSTSFSFGAAAAKTTPSFGTGTGSLFGGTTTQTSAPTFGVGSNTATTGGFGAQSTFGGFGGFGSTATSTAPTFGGFGSAATSTPGFSGFGGGTTTAQAGSNAFSFGFNQPTTSTSSLFSGTTTTGAFGGFGKPGGLGAGTTTGFGGFGSTLGAGGGFGQLPTGQQPQQLGHPQQPNAGVPGLDPIYNSVFNVCMFGDERDEILSKWNLLQACWGTGKGFYAPNMPPVEYTPQNPLCRFKAIAYSMKPVPEAKEGFVAVQFNKKEDEIRSQESQLQTMLNNVLGNKPNITVHIDNIRASSDSSTLVFFYVEEKGATGQSRRVPNGELANALIQPMQKQQLTSMGVVDLYPYNSPDKQQIKEYLETPPAGIDSRLWKQAQLDNPDPDKYIPVPVVGFSEVRWRYKCQIEENKRHQAFLDKIAEELAQLQNDNEAARLKIQEQRHKVVDLEHRVLQVLVRQEITRNIGVALRPEEEVLRSQLDTINSQLNAPQIKGRLSELLSQIRMHKQEASQLELENYSMSVPMQDEIRQFLEMQQNGIKALIDIMQNDMEDLKIIKEDMNRVLGKTS